MSNPMDGIISPDPGPGKIVAWDADPRSSTYGHVHVITAAEARSYRRAARRTGWRRRIQQIGRLIRRGR